VKDGRAGGVSPFCPPAWLNRLTCSQPTAAHSRGLWGSSTSAPPPITFHSSVRATVRTSVTELLRRNEDGVLRQLFGVYTDDLVKQDGRWLFAHRRFEMRHPMTITDRSD
jgi:SnoaL-like domain